MRPRPSQGRDLAVEPRLPEPLIIRPPTEAHSLLIRVTRGCKWNRCRFCGIYLALGQPTFEVRPVEEVRDDIRAARELHGEDWRGAFLGDADPLIAAPEDMCEILRTLRETFPKLERVRCYARAATCWLRKGHLADYKQAGLDLVHVGLETGSTELLKYHDKGVNQNVLIKSGLAVREADLGLSHYVLLGLGGADRWEHHVEETLKVLNAVQPEFVRFRRLWIYGAEGGPRSLLYEDVQQGLFDPQTPEGTVLELRAIISGIEFPTEIEAIHGNVYVRVKGVMPEARGKLLVKIDRFLQRPPEERAARYARPSVI